MPTLGAHFKLTHGLSFSSHSSVFPWNSFASWQFLVGSAPAPWCHVSSCSYITNGPEELSRISIYSILNRFRTANFFRSQGWWRAGCDLHHSHKTLSNTFEEETTMWYNFPWIPNVRFGLFNNTENKMTRICQILKGCFCLFLNHP